MCILSLNEDSRTNKRETTEPSFTLNEIRIYRVDLCDYIAQEINEKSMNRVKL